MEHVQTIETLPNPTEQEEPPVAELRNQLEAWDEGGAGSSAGVDALGAFLQEEKITAVVSVIKSGKEATVYCCRAHPNLARRAGPLVAAKVYRDRAHRAFKNDAVYWQGAKVGKRREQLAFEKQFQHVALHPEEVEPLFERVLDNVALWLTHHRVHADLSAFNILYWRDAIKVIDFPQAVDPRSDANAWDLFRRDLYNVCRYFSRYGIDVEPTWLADDLRRQYQDPRYRR